MKFECKSLVCRMVKVTFPVGAAPRILGRQSVAPTAAEAARNSRRESVLRDVWFCVRGVFMGGVPLMPGSVRVPPPNHSEIISAAETRQRLNFPLPPACSYLVLTDAPVCFEVRSLTRSLLLSHQSLRPRGRLSLTLRRSSSRTRIRFGMVSRNRDGRSTARFLDGSRGMSVGSLKRRSLRRGSIFVAGASEGGCKGFDLWSERKRAKSCEGWPCAVSSGHLRQRRR
jgi:hypothetical protein